MASEVPFIRYDKLASSLSDFYLGAGDCIFLDNIESLASDVDSIKASKIESSSVTGESFADRWKAIFDAFESSEGEGESRRRYTPDSACNPDGLASELYALIKVSYYEEGQLSPVDHELCTIRSKYGDDMCIKVIGALWRKCFASKNQAEHAYFLNSIRNMSYFLDSDEFLPYACSAVAHKDVLIKEAGIATFECWDKESHRFYLEALADTGIQWLDDYKRDVIASLGA